MDDTRQDSGQQQWLRTQSGRLGQRIARYLFVTLIVISAIEYVPSYYNQEQELLRNIERQGARTVAVLLSGGADQLTPDLQRRSGLVLARTPVKGFSVFRDNGEPLWSVGEPVGSLPDQLARPATPSIFSRLLGAAGFERTDNGRRFMAVWSEKDLSIPYKVAAKLDSTQIIAPLSSYRMKLIWMALVMAAVTTIIMLVVLNKAVLKPVTAIHHAINGANADLGKAHEWVIDTPADGEVGDLTKSVNGMLRNVSENFRVVQRQNEKILQEAELRQQAEEEARLKHRQLAEAIEAFPGGFAVFDSDDRLMISNQRWQEIYPVSADLVVPGVKFEDILRSGIAAERKRGNFAYGAYWFRDRMQQHREGTTDIERRLSTGQWIRTTERRTEDGGILGIWTDITDLKASESEHADLQEQFFRAQKYEALGTLAGGIAHDFDSLIATILGNVELLEGALGLDPAGREPLNAITGAGNKAKDLVRQILSFARQNPEEFEQIDLYDVVEEALSLLRTSMPKTITTEARIGRSSQVLADPAQMHQIVMNLCLNARDAIGERPGKLVIDLGEDGPSPIWPAAPANWTDATPPAQRVIVQQRGTRSLMWMGLQPAEPHIRLTVSDDGPGIDADTFRKIFDPFFTTKDVGKGTGLGLAAVQGIVLSHGGSIHVESTPGDGTKFEIRIPRRDTGSAEQADEAQIDPRKPGRILILDNEEQTIAALNQSLEQRGYTVSTMTDAGLALKTAEEAPETWDVIVANVTSAEGGTRIAKDFHAVRPDVAVILCGGSLTAAEQEEPGNARDSVLAMPIREADLVDALERCLPPAR